MEAAFKGALLGPQVYVGKVAAGRVELTEFTPEETKQDKEIQSKGLVAAEKVEKKKGTGGPVAQTDLAAALSAAGFQPTPKVQLSDKKIAAICPSSRESCTPPEIKDGSAKL